MRSTPPLVLAPPFLDNGHLAYIGIMHEKIALIVVVGLLLAACGSAPASAPTARLAKSTPAACAAPKTVYLFPGGTGIWDGESALWTHLSLFPSNRIAPASVRNDALVEAVVPSATAWVVRDLRVGAKGAKEISRAATALRHSASPATVISAKVCFTSWNQVRVSHLAMVTGPTAAAAVRLTYGMEMVAPTVVQPGGAIFVLLDRGSFDDAIYQGGFNGVVDWYAVRTDGMQVYRTPLLHHVAAGNSDLFEFGMPQGMVGGTYQLVLLTPQRASAKGMGFLNGAVGGDFTFQVP